MEILIQNGIGSNSTLSLILQSMCEDGLNDVYYEWDTLKCKSRDFKEVFKKSIRPVEAN